MADNKKHRAKMPFPGDAPVKVMGGPVARAFIPVPTMLKTVCENVTTAVGGKSKLHM